MNKYINGKIYMLRSKNNEKVYIGSTCKELDERLKQHKALYNSYTNNQNGHYTTAFELIKEDDCYIQLIKNYPCTDRKELHQEEGKLQQVSTKCINNNIAGGLIPLIDHVNKWNEKNSDKYECKICGFKTPRKYDYTRHLGMKRHLNMGNSIARPKIKRQKVVKPPKPSKPPKPPKPIKEFKCAECDYVINRKMKLYEHKKTHKKPYACDKCDFTTTVMVKLTKHMRTHVEKTYKCLNCSFGCNRMGDFKRHNKKDCIAVIPKYKCTLCEYTGTNISKFSAHRQIHKIKKKDLIPETIVNGEITEIKKIDITTEQKESNGIEINIISICREANA